MPTLSQNCHSEVAKLKEQYPDVKQLLKDYSPEIVTMTMCVTDLSRIYEGCSPTLCTVREAYGLTVAASWIQTQLMALSSFAKVTEGLTDENALTLSHFILGKYDYLRMSEFIYFIGRVMMGKYGYFYGSVDPMRIMSFLNQFMSERLVDLSRLEKERQEAELVRRMEDSRRNAMSYEEYRKTLVT